MDIIKLQPDFYLDLIRNNKPFSLSRFGDGEVLCMSNHSTLKENCDGSAFLPELTEPMLDIFRNKHDYYHCLLDCTFDQNLKTDTDWFKSYLEENCSDMKFYDGEIWQELSFSGRITELIEAINVYNPCFIGGSRLSRVAHMKGMGSYTHIQTPDTDNFIYLDWIKEQILKLHNDGFRMFCFSAGYTTKIVIDQLYPIMGHDSFMLDFGSVFDPYCGNLSRDSMVTKGFDYFKQFLR